jgi:L-serine/L-threonine ammonia-lyase
MVELAAGATLSVAYSMDLFSRVFNDISSEKRRTIVFVVCGGFKITLADLNSYQTHLEARRAEEFLMWIDECHFKTRVE